MTTLTRLAQPAGGRTAVDHGARATDVEVERLRAHLASLAHELQWIEWLLSEDGGALDALLAGRRLVYVGGRPGSNAVLRERLARAGGVFMHHVALIDAGDSARARRFAALLRRADTVLCPLDTIDPESLAALRTLCSRHGVPWVALRTSTVASFVAGLLRADRRRLHPGARPRDGYKSHGCRRQG